jgi:DNA-binding MarR family transcriptional regulator
MKIKIHPMDELLSFWVYRMQTQSSTVLRRAFEAAGYILTGEQWGVLTRLKEDEGINQSQLGEKMLKDRHNVTRILNLLEKRGYIKRRADSADMRAYRIFLTQEGRAVQESLNSIVENHLKNMYGGLSPEDLAAMRRIVERVVRNLEKTPPDRDDTPQNGKGADADN